MALSKKKKHPDQNDQDVCKKSRKTVENYNLKMNIKDQST